MTDPIEFLTARLDEEQEVAEREFGNTERPFGWEYVKGDADSMLVGMFPPSRVLADIAAKRAILELHSGSHECSSWNRFHGEFDHCMWVEADENCSTVLLLTQPHRYHPDFDPAWTTP